MPLGRLTGPCNRQAPSPPKSCPGTVEIHDIPVAANDMPDVKYVRAPERILLVRPSNRVVVAEITQ